MVRSDLLDILDAGLRAADGRRLVRDWLGHNRPPGSLHLIAVGKAACPMAMGALDVLGDDVEDGFVVTPRPHGDGDPGDRPQLRVYEGAHPVPDSRSIRAGEAMLDWIAELPTGKPVLALISGGASSLVEAPPPGADAGELARLNRWLLGSGLDIFGMNAVRRRVSRIKDGGLAAALGGRSVLALYLSDVKGDDPAWIGSGLLAHAPVEMPAGLPDWVTDLAAGVSARPLAGHVEHHIVGNLGTAMTACEARARHLGYGVIRHGEWLEGPVREVAERIVADLDAAAPGLHIWGGEPVVALPADPGRGGRNQHLALCCALAISGRTDLAILCAATDGMDGNSEDAGALIDGGSVQRGRDGGADPARCLAAADSGRFLEAAGDLVHTGPTSTNVNDLVIGVKIAPGYTASASDVEGSRTWVSDS